MGKELFCQIQLSCDEVNHIDEGPFASPYYATIYSEKQSVSYKAGRPDLPVLEASRPKYYVCHRP